MKAVCWYGQHDVRVTEVEEPLRRSAGNEVAENPHAARHVGQGDDESGEQNLRNEDKGNPDGRLGVAAGQRRNSESYSHTGE